MRYLLWTNVIMALSAGGWALVTLRGLNLPLDWGLVALAFCLALGFYTRDRLDPKERQTDALTMPARTAWINRYEKALKAEMWSAFFLALLLVILQPKTILPLLSGLGFALSYTLRWLPWRGQRVGWKHLPGMKMPFVAILWTLTTVITPAVVYESLWRGKTWLLAGGVCGAIMVQILLNDLRDQQGDQQSGTASIPALWGTTRARQTGYIISILAFLLAGWVLPFTFLALTIYNIFILRYYQSAIDSRWRLWIESQGLWAGMFAWFIHFLYLLSRLFK